VVDLPDRAEARDFLTRRLLAGSSVLMLAMRRTGKTWLCHRIEEDADKFGYRAIYCDLEDCEDENAVFGQISQCLDKHIDFSQMAKDRFFNTLRRVVAGGADASNLKELLLRGDWREALRNLLGVLSEDTLPWVIIVDELPLFVMKLVNQDRGRAESFLHQLRAHRQRFPRIRWLLTGSVGLDVIARRERLGGTMNDVERYELLPFDAAAARIFLKNLNRDGRCPYPFSLGEAEFKHLVSRLNWLSPYYLEKVSISIRPTGMMSSSEIDTRSATIVDIDRAFELLMSQANRGYFAAWSEHIDKNFGGLEHQRLFIVLSRLSLDPAGETFATLLAVVGRRQVEVTRGQLREALDVLVSDGYLEEMSGRYRFRSGLIRLWWKRWQADEEEEILS
jgi:hypothetical protein